MKRVNTPFIHAETKITLPEDRYGQFCSAHASVRKRVILHAWNSEEGRRRFVNAAYKNAFFRLAHCYQAQINPFYCGVACVASVLNALYLGKGKIPVQSQFSYQDADGAKADYRLHTQLTLLTPETEKIKRKTDIAPTLRNKEEQAANAFNPGLDLHEVKALLEHYEANACLYLASQPVDEAIAEFTDRVRDVIMDPEKVMIANFHGEQLGADTKGHYSIIAAYDEDSDSILVLDTAAHKNPWFWAPMRHFYLAMHKASDEKVRGYLIVS